MVTSRGGTEWQFLFYFCFLLHTLTDLPLFKKQCAHHVFITEKICCVGKWWDGSGFFFADKCTPFCDHRSQYWLFFLAGWGVLLHPQPFPTPPPPPPPLLFQGRAVKQASVRSKELWEGADLFAQSFLTPQRWRFEVLVWLSHFCSEDRGVLTWGLD